MLGGSIPWIDFECTWISYSTISISHIGYIQNWVNSSTFGDRVFVISHGSNSWLSSPHTLQDSKIFSNYTGTIYWYDSYLTNSPGGASLIYQRPALLIKFVNIIRIMFLY